MRLACGFGENRSCIGSFFILFPGSRNLVFYGLSPLCKITWGKSKQKRWKDVMKGWNTWIIFLTFLMKEDRFGNKWATGIGTPYSFSYEQMWSSYASWEEWRILLYVPLAVKLIHLFVCLFNLLGMDQKNQNPAPVEWRVTCGEELLILLYYQKFAVTNSSWKQLVASSMSTRTCLLSCNLF